MLIESNQPGRSLSRANLLPRKVNDEDIVTWLKHTGHISEPPLSARAYASRWKSLSKKEQEAITSELANLSEGPLASDIIISSKDGTG